MSRLRRVLFLSQARAEAMIPPHAAALLSITDVTAPVARLREGWAAVLRLGFDDVDPEDRLFQEFMLGDEEDYVPLTPVQAAEIAGFVRDIAGRCSCLVVHCRYGQSRSAAVAKAVCDAYGLRFPRDYELHNPYVYRNVQRALTGADPAEGRPP